MSEEAFRIDHSMYMNSRDFLPMPIPQSPVLCMIIQRPMFERYTDSFKALSMLRTIVQCFALNPYLRNERIEKAHAAVLEKTTEIETALHERLEGANVDAFLEIMELSTFERIHAYETCVRDMFNLDVPLEACLTPVERGIVAADPERMQQVLYHFLKNKEAIRNVRMEKAQPEGERYTHVKYFTCQPQGRLYNGFLDERTVFEYFKFIQ